MMSILTFAVTVLWYCLLKHAGGEIACTYSMARAYYIVSPTLKNNKEIITHMLRIMWV